MPAPPRTLTQGQSNEMAKRRIGELLVEAGLVQVGQLQEGLALQSVRGGKIVETLILLGHLNADEFLSFVARQPGVASIDLSKYFIPRDVRELIPRDMAIKHEIVPIDRLGHLLTVAMACPLDSATVRDIALRTGLQVKPLLCAASDIRVAIDRYYSVDDVDLPDAQVVEPGEGGLDASFKLSNVARLIRQIDSLPALPETVRRVQEATLNPLTSVRDLSDIIVFDPPIAAKVLSVANSAAYGFPHRIDDVTLAVSLLGLHETYSIVLSVAVINVFDKSKTFDYRAFWLSSICCAAATRIVAKASGRSSMTGLFSAGLLHDIGRLVLAEVVPDVYGLLDQSLTDEKLLAAEETLLSLSHMEAGYLLAEHWGLPIEIAEPIRFHHRPNLAVEAKENVAIVAVAVGLAEATGETVDDNREVLARLETPLRMLGLDKEAAEAVLAAYLALRDNCIHDTLLLALNVSNKPCSLS